MDADKHRQELDRLTYLINGCAYKVSLIALVECRSG